MERLTLFQIGIPGSAANTTDALYANGNHQCKVVIRILKQTSVDGAAWQAALLSEGEKSSLTVLPYANELRPQQAKGWYCDVNANQYAQGLWRRDGLHEAPAPNEAEAETGAAAETVFRYLRFNGKEASRQPARFIASIILDDGTQYSTRMDNGSVTFDSSVTIHPQECHALSVNDMTRSVQNVVNLRLYGVIVNTYYWILPDGLTIVEEGFAGAGATSPKLEYAYAMTSSGYFNMGMAIRPSVTELILGEIDGKIDYGIYYRIWLTQVPLINSASMMRAACYICRTRLTTNDSNYNNSLLWTITDNYGCSNQFILKGGPAAQGFTLRLLDFVFRRMMTLTEFQIGFVATAASATDALYANGKQQCKVFIKILKKISGDGYNWRTTGLSEYEKASLTVLPYSNELRPAQASGWYCDTEPNKYDEGLWRGTGSVGLTGSSETMAAGTNTPTEVIYRYMRFDGKEARIQPTRFMASITLDDGTQYSTHLQKEGEPAIESSIIITPQSPYSLRVNDLTHTRQDAFTNADVEVDTYYWSLPGGLRILGESYSGQGYEDSNMAYAYNIVDGSRVRIGVAIKVDVTSLTLGNIDSGLKSNQSAQVPLIDSNSMLRGLRYSCNASATNNRSSYNSLTYWIITDNYGCQSTFVLKANDSDNGNTLELLNG